MQFTSVLVALFAAAAVAAPAPGYGYHRSHKTKAPVAANQCADNQEQSCCNSPDGKAVLGLECAVDVLGGPCSGSVQCCDSDGKGGLLGLNLCVPIQL